MKNTSYLGSKASLSGASILEIVVAVFIFVIVVMGTASIFISSTNSRKTIQDLQGNYDKVSVALNEMAKVITTSELSPDMTSTGSNGTSALLIYSVSQHACIQYAFQASTERIDKVEVPMIDGETAEDCTSAYISGASVQDIVDISVLGHFRVEPEVSGSSVSSVTIFMEVAPHAGADRTMFLQTTITPRKPILEYK